MIHFPQSPTGRRLRAALALSVLPAIGACSQLVVLHPAGDVARQQANLVIASTALMLLIIVPVIILTLFFAWRYRASNVEATYEPEWDHSTQLELVIWAAPLMIIICLGALTWISSHVLDPYRPLTRTASGQPIAPGVKPLVVDVVALDWKWLFIYPEYGIATVNQIAAPVGRPITFNLTSSSVMNSFFIPSLAGQIYTMPGMETKLHAVMNQPGRYHGMSSNYSGAGFSEMDFWFSAMPQAGFDRWVSQVRAGGPALTKATYMKLAQPTENVPPLRFPTVDGRLYHDILNQCVVPGTTCMDASTMHDMNMGSEHPVNDTASPHMGKPREGAIFKGPDEKPVAPNVDVPRGKTPGVDEPGTPTNRNMTLNDVHPGERHRAAA